MIEFVPFVQTELVIEIVEHRGVDGNEFLQTSHSSKSGHCPLHRRNGRHEFSIILLRNWPVVCLSGAPISFSAAALEQS